MQPVIDFFSNPTNLAVIFGIGWGLCEILNQIPSIKANSTFQFVYNFFKSKQPSK